MKRNYVLNSHVLITVKVPMELVTQMMEAALVSQDLQEKIVQIYVL
jgi:hypothetical protein